MGLNNPNDSIFVVPQEYGLDPDDRYFGSIGDATMKHISSMSGADRMCWEDLYMAPSGAIFRREPTTSSYDPDPLKIRGCDLDDHRDEIKAQFIYAAQEEHRDAQERDPSIPPLDLEAIRERAEKYIKSIEEAYEEEDQRRESSEDALDEDRVPYHEWEKYPQLWQSIDIPSAPKDRFVYLGECRQQFYDHFPNGHPDAPLLQRAINMLNRDWEVGITDGYAEFCREVFPRWPWKIKYALDCAVQASKYLQDDICDPEDTIINMLTAIDNDWRIRYVNAVAAKAMQDPVINLLLHKEKEWQAMFDAGQSVHKHIVAFGKLLFENFRSQLNGYHWSRYRRAKVKFAPRVLFKEKDINRCGVADLRNILRISTEDARKIWFERPFESVEELYNKGYISENSFCSDETSEKVIYFIEKHAKQALDEESKARMAEVRKYLIQWQGQKKVQMSSDQWHMVWRYYKLLRKELDRRINVSRQQEREGRLQG